MNQTKPNQKPKQYSASFAAICYILKLMSSSHIKNGNFKGNFQIIRFFQKSIYFCKSFRKQFSIPSLILLTMTSSIVHLKRGYLKLCIVYSPFKIECTFIYHGIKSGQGMHLSPALNRKTHWFLK